MDLAAKGAGLEGLKCPLFHFPWISHKENRFGRPEAPSVPFRLEFGSKWQAAKHVQGVLAQENAKIGRNWRAKDRI